MTKLYQNAPFLTTDDGLSIVGIKQPGGSDHGLLRVIAQSGVPVLLLSSATNISATGAITGLTALPYAPTGIVQVYCFAQAGLAAGLYYASFPSVIACQLFLDSGGTVMPQGITAGAYAGGTTEATLVAVPLPVGTMGLNSVLRVQALGSHVNSAGQKTYRQKIGGVTFNALGPTITLSQSLGRWLRNRGVINAQVSQPSSGLLTEAGQTVASGTANQFTSFDFSVAQNVNFTGQLALAADFLILEAYSVEVS